MTTIENGEIVIRVKSASPDEDLMLWQLGFARVFELVLQDCPSEIYRYEIGNLCGLVAAIAIFEHRTWRKLAEE